MIEQPALDALLGKLALRKPLLMVSKPFGAWYPHENN